MTNDPSTPQAAHPDSHPRPVATTTGQVLATLPFAARRLAGPLVVITLVVTALVLVAHLAAWWQGGDITGPGTSEDAVWLGVEADPQGFVVRGLAWMIPITTGLVAFGLAAAAPHMLIAPLISVGVTRRATTSLVLIALAGMHGFVALVAAVATAFSAGSVAAWSQIVIGSARPLVTLGVLMLVALAVSTAWMYGRLPGAVATAAMMAAPLLILVLGLMPSGPVTALVVAPSSIAVFVLLMRRVPVR